MPAIALLGKLWNWDFRGRVSIHYGDSLLLKGLDSCACVRDGDGLVDSGCANGGVLEMAVREVWGW